MLMRFPVTAQKSWNENSHSYSDLYLLSLGPSCSNVGYRTIHLFEQLDPEATTCAQRNVGIAWLDFV